MVDNKVRVTLRVPESVLCEFRSVASSRTFRRNWLSLAAEEAMKDYILKYGDCL